MAQSLTFTTAISGYVDKDNLELRGTALTELIAEANFVKTLFLSLTGRQPNAAEEKLLNAILVAAIDHGISPASGFVPRVSASSGNSALTAMASGLLALGPYHGGAISACMEVLQRVSDSGADTRSACQQLVTEYRSQKQRLPGFGHPHYTDADPRTQQLFTLAEEAELDTTIISIAQELESALEESAGRKLVINVDGGMATLLLTLGIDPIAGNGIFGVARIAGSLAHIVEEQRSGNWVRRIPDEAIEYNAEQPPKGEG